MPKNKPDFGTISARTAIARKKISAPTRRLIEIGRIPRDSKVLNHGSGRAALDSEALSSAVNTYAEYDPNYAPDREVFDTEYDIVISNYVMNVLPPDLRAQAWKDVASVTAGTAYITVRSTGDKAIRGKKYKDGVITSIGTFQKPYTARGLIREARKYFNTVELIMGRRGGIFWTIAASDAKVPKTKPATEAKIYTTRKASDTNDFNREITEIRRRAGICS